MKELNRWEDLHLKYVKCLMKLESFKSLKLKWFETSFPFFIPHRDPVLNSICRGTHESGFWTLTKINVNKQGSNISQLVFRVYV